MRRRLRAWWKRLRDNARTLWSRWFSRERSSSERDALEPPSRPALLPSADLPVEPSATEHGEAASQPDRNDSNVEPIVDAEFEELLAQPESESEPSSETAVEVETAPSVESKSELAGSGSSSTHGSMALGPGAAANLDFNTGTTLRFSDNKQRRRGRTPSLNLRERSAPALEPEIRSPRSGAPIEPSTATEPPTESPGITSPETVAELLEPEATESDPGLAAEITTTDTSATNETDAAQLAADDTAPVEAATDEPVADDLAVAEAATDAPVAAEPAVAEAATDEPVADDLAVAEAATDEPVADDLAVAEAATDAPVADDLAVAEAATDAPVAADLAVAEAATDAPVAAEPAVAEAAADAPVAADLAVAEAATDAPVAAEPAAAEAATAEPAPDDTAAAEAATDAYDYDRSKRDEPSWPSPFASESRAEADRKPEATARTPDRRSLLAQHELDCYRRLLESQSKRPSRDPESLDVPKDYVPMVESRDTLFQLHLAGFEGPLDLLLFLIRRHKIEIFDIPIGFICAEYLRYIRMMEDLDIDVASEFLFMASELLHIKSKMLLPKPAEVDEEDDIDPRAELVARLLEYQKYKRAAAELHGVPWLGRDRFPRSPEPLPAPEGVAPLKEVGVFALIEAFNRVLERQKPEVRHQVLLEQVSVRQRIKQLIQQLRGEESTPFEAMLAGLSERLDVIVTFLAVLEMAKRQLLRVYVSEGDHLYVRARFDDIDTAMGQLDGLDEEEYA
ncbi:MAG: segregation/condensation protein A [Myxococcota bacterium]